MCKSINRYKTAHVVTLTFISNSKVAKTGKIFLFGCEYWVVPSQFQKMMYVFLDSHHNLSHQDSY